MTSIQTKARTRRVGPWAWQVAAALVLTACDASSLLDVNTPDQITPAAAASPAGAAAIRAAAIGNFANFFAGDPSGGSPVGMNMYSGIFSDEIISSRGGTEHLDQRADRAHCQRRQRQRGPEAQPRAQALHQAVSDVDPQHEERAVGEVDDAGDAEDQRQPSAHQEQRGRTGQAVEQLDE